MIFAAVVPWLARVVLSRAVLRSAAYWAGRALRFIIPRRLQSAIAWVTGFIFMGALEWLRDRSFSEGFGAVQDAAYTIVAFDWNQSDQSIKDTINQNNNQLAQLVGRFAGGGLVRIASVGAAYATQLKYPVVAGRIAIDLAEDTSGQMRNDFTAMIEGVRQLTLENAILTMVLTFRSRRWFGMEPRQEDGPHWSFASEMERRVESIRHPLLRNFVQGFLEGAEDAFWDVGYIIAGTLDDVVAANRYSQQQQLGPERAIVVTPDTRVPDETIVLAGPQEMVAQNIDGVLATHRMIHNRDVGSIVAQPVEDYLKARPQLRKLVITFKSRQLPPWRGTDGRRAKEAVYAIPDAKPGLTWVEIKAAASAFTWGPFLAVAKLNNQRQMQVYGATAAEARSTLVRLASLSTAEILKLSVSEEQVVNPALLKRPTPMYPAYGSLIGRRNSLDSEGRTVLDGRNFTEQVRKFPLYTPTEPPGFTVIP